MLKTVVETIDGLDEAVAKLYAEKDGIFVLQVEGVDAHPDVQSLKSAYQRVKDDKAEIAKERDALKERLKSVPDDFDLEKWEKAKDGKPDEAAIVSLRKELEAERDEWKSKFHAAKEASLKSAVERDLTEALTAAGVTKSGLIAGARRLLADKVQVGDDGKPFVESDMGPMALIEHVKRWAATPEGGDYVTKESGGGAKSVKNMKLGGENPWKAESRNLTRQAEILKTDPAEAHRLKQEAGAL